MTARQHPLWASPDSFQPRSHTTMLAIVTPLCTDTW